MLGSELLDYFQKIVLALEILNLNFFMFSKLTFSIKDKECTILLKIFVFELLAYFDKVE